MICLLYVSRSALPPGHEQAQIAQIYNIAIKRNAALDITGALLFVDGYFAQILEGPGEAVNRLMVGILRDPRHTEVRIIEVSRMETRAFPSWTMAQVPPSPSARRYLTDVMERPEGDSSAAVRGLFGYMAEYAGASPSG
jgi:hypothetical protein